MGKQTEAIKLALEGAANYIDTLGGDSQKYRQALAEQPAQRTWVGLTEWQPIEMTDEDMYHYTNWISKR